jgi:hypothetical protein
VGVERSEGPAPEGKKATPGETPESKSKKLLYELFPHDVDKNGKVFADWFTGNLRVFSKPVKRTYKNEGDVQGYEMLEYTEITLLQLKDGKVTRQTSFPTDEYWKKFDTYLEYRKLKAEEVAAISEHAGFLDAQDKNWENIGSIDPEGPMKSEKDFPVFLTRYMTSPVKIPLTKFAMIKDATLDFKDTGWILDDGLRITDGGALLMLEMGASNVPKGPWSNFTGGAVQVIIRLGDLGAKEVTFSEKDSTSVKVINNFAGTDHSSESVDGTLKVTRSADGKVLLSGTVKLSSRNPTTYQEIDLENNEVPLYDIKEYLAHEDPPGEKNFFDAGSIYNRIVKQSADTKSQ